MTNTEMSGMDRLTELLSRASECFKHHGVAGGLAADIDDALADHRRASQAAPAHEDADRGMLIKELSDAARWRRLPDNESHLATAVLLERAVAALTAAPAPSDGLREEANAVLAGLGPVHGKLMYEGYEGSANAVMNAADWIRAALSASPAQEGGE